MRNPPCSAPLFYQIAQEINSDIAALGNAPNSSYDDYLQNELSFAQFRDGYVACDSLAQSLLEPFTNVVVYQHEQLCDGVSASAAAVSPCCSRAPLGLFGSAADWAV